MSAQDAIRLVRDGGYEGVGTSKRIRHIREIETRPFPVRPYDPDGDVHGVIRYHGSVTRESLPTWDRV